MIKAEEFMMLKGRPNQGESGGALGAGRQSPPPQEFVQNGSKTFSFKRPWITTCPLGLLDFPMALWWKQEEDYYMGLQQQ